MFHNRMLPINLSRITKTSARIRMSCYQIIRLMMCSPQVRNRMTIRKTPLVNHLKEQPQGRRILSTMNESERERIEKVM